MGRRPPVFDFPSPHLSRVASALRDALRGAWPFGRKAKPSAAVERQPGKRIHFEALEQRLLLSGGVLPAGSSLLQENEPDNNQLLTATMLPLSEDPAGSGLAIGRAEGRQEPAVSGDYWSDPDWWRLELQKGDVISVSVDTPASDVDPYLALNDGTGSGITSDDNSGPGNDAAISHYTVQATGVYYIQVGRYGYNSTPGAYELHVERTRGVQQESDASYSNDTLGGANPLSLAGGQGHRTATVSGTIMAAEGSNTDEDVYNLGLFNAGNVIELSTRLPGDGTLS
ncbi:pre-peptidase C-terminal domain-containing protein, partial [Accumulibacter sp.]|uniref:pre-peptidase C-terminal domain-containing protein n=1 Tax=Accumulibacter sp. TaxID=2053492 RepID=UPI0035AEA4DC